MQRKVIIIGAGGHGKVIADIVQKSGDKVVGFLDDNTNRGSEFIGFPILGTVKDFKKFVKEAKFVIAIGDPYIREGIFKKIKGAEIYTAIHPDSVISGIEVIIGEGTVVMANAVINSGSRIGKQCIINSGAIVEHDNIIEDYVHISVGAKLAGSVHVGKFSWVGISVAVSNNISICSRCIIRAGAVVIRDLTVCGQYQGIPAKLKEE